MYGYITDGFLIFINVMLSVFWNFTHMQPHWPPGVTNGDTQVIHLTTTLQFKDKAFFKEVDHTAKLCKFNISIKVSIPFPCYDHYTL